MDEFFNFVPFAKKRRAHFHRFMQSIHHNLRELQGEADPLKLIAARMARETQLLCLDEFHVTDIGDAMLMRGLLEGLIEQRIVLVTTSNQHPDELYAHGLQRAQFLPAIELINTNLEVVELDGDSDYRLRTLTRAGVYHQPLSAGAERALEDTFVGVAGEPGSVQVRIELEGRQVLTRRVATGAIWFDFAELCEGPRGTADYIELARRYHTVLVSGVPRFRPDQAESLRRFTWLVDEFYDRQVKLILSAEATVERLYDGVPERTDTERTRSRLIEMQTTRYLSLPHLA
jgi:cell division protein ZapE